MNGYERNIITIICVLIILFGCNALYRALVVYDEEDYCCRHMSRDAEDFLESFGIPVILIRGQNDDSGHLWFNVFGMSFDSVTLFPTPVEWFFPDIIIYFSDWEDYLEHVDKRGR